MPQLTRLDNNVILGDSPRIIMGRDDSHRCAPDKAHGSDAGVAQSSGQATRIRDLGGAVSDMHHGPLCFPETRLGLGRARPEIGSMQTKPMGRQP